MEQFNPHADDWVESGVYWDAGKKADWSRFLPAFYGVVYEAAEYMAYDDPLQDKVVALFVELAKYPWKEQWIYLVSFSMYFLCSPLFRRTNINHAFH